MLLPFIFNCLKKCIFLVDYLEQMTISLGNQRFRVRVRLLAMCRGEFSAVIAWPSVCEAGGSGSEKLKNALPLSLQPCDS